MPLSSLLSLHCFLSFFFCISFFLLVTAAVVFYESGGIFFTWVSVEKGGQSIKFELLKTIATSSSVVVSICSLEKSVLLLLLLYISVLYIKYTWFLLVDVVY